jgi:hypothetical protein
MFLMQVLGRNKDKKSMMKALQGNANNVQATAEKSKGKSKTKEIDTVDINDLYKI